MTSRLHRPFGLAGQTHYLKLLKVKFIRLRKKLKYDGSKPYSPELLKKLTLTRNSKLESQITNLIAKDIEHERFRRLRQCPQSKKCK